MKVKADHTNYSKYSLFLSAAPVYDENCLMNKCNDYIGNGVPSVGNNLGFYVGVRKYFWNDIHVWIYFLSELCIENNRKKACDRLAKERW